MTIRTPARLLGVFFLAAGTGAGAGAWAEESFEEAQARLDAECEAAREAKLAPERERYIQECVDEKLRPDRESCERFYADYGNQSGNRAPLYLDLPECVKAFEHRRQAR